MRLPRLQGRPLKRPGEQLSTIERIQTRCSQQRRDRHRKCCRSSLRPDHIGSDTDCVSNHRIMSEEDTTAHEVDYSGPLWIIDPIDGTANYVRGHRYFGISIAFAFDGVVQAGCVHAPMLVETFLATKGGGAKLNGSPIKVSASHTLMRSIVSTGFPHEKSDFDHLLKRVSLLLRNCQDVRRSASPVLDISSRCDGTPGCSHGNAFSLGRRSSRSDSRRSRS